MSTDLNIFDCLLDPIELFEFYRKIGTVLKNDRDIASEHVHGAALRNSLILLMNTAMIQLIDDEYTKLIHCETNELFYTELIGKIKNHYSAEVDTIINCDKHYDESKNQFYIYVNNIPLKYMGLAMLMEQACEFERINNREYFIGIDHYRDGIKRKPLVSIEALQNKLRRDIEIGEQAEKYAYEYEKIRLKKLGINKEPISVSNIDVMAGYDMVSYENKFSERQDRFIEIKAISKSGFYWSRNEYETAKRKAENYYLYLIDLRRTNDPDYSPEIIQNPALSIMEADGWFVEAESYHIKQL